MADLTFNTIAGATIARKLFVLYLNTGTSSSPVWSPIGKRVEDSSVEYDWQEESKVDIFGQTYTTFKAPILTQTFDPCELDAGDTAQVKFWNMAIKDQDISAMTTNDMLLVHCYAGTATSAMFAERYNACAVKPSGLGGSDTVTMPIDVTFGGERTLGTAAVGTGGAITFTAAA
ncbi:MAG: hypothetical protein KBS75_09365 [Bacteroidales bacterium]|nr:hypothetical protein [Candidatus Equimonas faecalis]